MFLANRNTISQRLRDKKLASDPTYSGTFIAAVDDSTGTREGYDGYSYNSAEVLIPAFLAAYGDQDPSEVVLDGRPLLPMPNWNLILMV